MTIVPVNGTVFVQQGNRVFNKLYEKSFPDNAQGMKDAYAWATAIAMGWDETQDDDWNKSHAA